MPCTGTLDVPLEGHGEPWVLVDPSDLRSNEFFSRPKQVQHGARSTVSTLSSTCHAPSQCLAT